MHFPDIRRVATVTASAALVAATVLVGTGPAQAAPAGGASATTVAATTSTTAARSGLTPAQQAGEYWTKERMRTAISADVLVKKAGAKAGKGLKPTGAARSVPPAAPTVTAASVGSQADGDISAYVAASATVGKVFFYNPADGKNYVCSAGAVNSTSKLLVMSAGHCVHGGRGGQWMQNWIFVPLYNYGAEPYGRWSAKYLTAFNAWINDSNLDRDVSYITVYPNASGQRLVDRVGGNGLSVNYSYTEAVTILAYPAAPPYDGGWQQYCQGTTYRPGSENKIALNCGFTGGSSGSVWLRLYNDVYGYVNGIMSTLNSAGVNKSSYFDTAVMDAYNSVAARV
ncbi:trypsin-like serine peptidase [Micromonospora sp. NPDC002575]|uniref:trypsin-like serine peptidase n=1 Tax=Micromonospora sp. NPDC002575 TaxID=3364222 RepID=UPI0036CECF3F